MVYFFLINFYFTANLFAQNTIPTNQLSPEVKQKVLEARQRAETAFDFKTGHFKQGITDQERQQLYNDLLDSLVMTDDEYYRFDRTEKQLFIDESEKQKQEQHINELLDRCIEYIGKDDLPPLKTRVEDDNLKLKLELPNTDDSQVLLKNIQINYLANKVYQCSHFLYGNYSLQDFEYYDVVTPKTALDRKRQMLEPFYEDIYLAIRKAGLLRVIPDANYPKSIIRIIADNNGLSDYIKEQEKQSNKKLSHKKLAISFYKTQQNWLQNITSYIKGEKTFAASEHIKKYCPREEIGVIKYMPWQDTQRQYVYGYSDYFEPQCFRLILSNELFDFLDSKNIESEKYFDFDKWGRSFKKNITEREKIEAVNNELDKQVITDLQLYRLNRWEKPTAYISPISNIEKASELLSQCISDLGLKKLSIDRSVGAHFEDYTADYLYGHTGDSILEPLVMQCTTGLYGENYNPIHFMKMPALHGNKKQAEQAYIKAYLLMKEDKLLRVTPSAFYPLSLVKEQAKESGFDEFLLKKEMEEKKEKMDYQRLLIEFYGSYKLWTIAVSDFISEQK